MVRTKSKRKKAYWEHYIEYLEDGNLRAECKFCYKSFAVDGNLNGTKNIKHHSKKCLGNASNKDKGKGRQTELFFQSGEGDKDEDDKLKYGTVNLKDVGEALIYMIIVDELPFKHVEKAGFKHFVQVACPRFHIPSRNTI